MTSLKALLVLSVLLSFLRPLFRLGKAEKAIRLLAGLVMLAAILKPLTDGISFLKTGWKDWEGKIFASEENEEKMPRDHRAYAQALAAELTGALQKEYGLAPETMVWDIELEESNEADEAVGITCLFLTVSDLPPLVSEGMIRQYLVRLLGCSVFVNGKGG